MNYESLWYAECLPTRAPVPLTNSQVTVSSSTHTRTRTPTRPAHITPGYVRVNMRMRTRPFARKALCRTPTLLVPLTHTPPQTKHNFYPKSSALDSTWRIFTRLH